VEIFLIELLLWVGLIFLFWALHDGLNHVESEINHHKDKSKSIARSEPRNFDHAEDLSDLIGRYRDKPIYRFATIHGECYQFQYILPWESFTLLVNEEKCLAPGLVYARCLLVQTNSK
jgi:hypothetical protein